MFAVIFYVDCIIMILVIFSNVRTRIFVGFQRNFEPDLFLFRDYILPVDGQIYDFLRWNTEMS